MTEGAILCRILQPADPWVDECSEEERAANFRGQYEEISVSDQSVCGSVRALAAFYGARSGAAAVARFFSLVEREVADAGGVLLKTPSSPPWPPEYCEAHRDIVGDTERVAREMAIKFTSDPGRVTAVARESLLAEICSLLALEPVDARFRKYAQKKLTTLHNLERPLWNRLAQRFPYIPPHT
jgi:hypothetical protein